MYRKQGLAKGMRWAARIVGLVITAFLLMMVIGETITSIQAEGFKFDVESLFVVVPAVIALAACIVSWWRERLGGSLLILVSIAFGVLPSIGAGWSLLRALQGWLMLGLPFLIAGILFLISSWLSRKSDSSAPPPSVTS
jgi:hypothetical protein